MLANLLRERHLKYLMPQVVSYVVGVPAVTHLLFMVVPEHL
jgi:hypothetical protein